MTTDNAQAKATVEAVASANPKFKPVTEPIYEHGYWTVQFKPFVISQPTLQSWFLKAGGMLTGYGHRMADGTMQVTWKTIEGAMTTPILVLMDKEEAQRTVGKINACAGEMADAQATLNDLSVTPDTSLSERENAIRAAAFIDGEGCISVQVQRGKNGFNEFAILVMVANTNPKLLEWFKANYGGSIQKSKSTKGAAKEQYHWFVKSKMAENLIRQIAPFLLLKSEQAGVALEIRRVTDLYKPSLERNEMLFNLKREIHRLNKRGVA